MFLSRLATSRLVGSTHCARMALPVIAKALSRPTLLSRGFTASSATSNQETKPDPKFIYQEIERLVTANDFHKMHSTLKELFTKFGPTSADEVQEERMQKGLVVVRGVNLALKILADRGRSRDCDRIYSWLNEAKLSPTIGTLNHMIVARGNAKELARAVELYDRMKAANVDMRDTHAALIRAYFACDEDDKAFELLQKLHDDKQPITPSTMSAFVSAYARRRDVPKAIKMLEESKVRGVSPSAEAFTDVVAACAHTGRLELADDVLYKMKAENHWPRFDTFSPLLARLARDKPDQALALVDKLRQTGVYINAATFRPVLNLYEQRRRPDLMWEVVDKMVAGGVRPALASLSGFLRLDKADAEVDKVEQYVRAHKVPVNHMFLNAARDALVKKGLTEEAAQEHVLQLAKDVGTEPRFELSKVRPGGPSLKRSGLPVVLRRGPARQRGTDGPRAPRRARGAKAAAPKQPSDAQPDAEATQAEPQPEGEPQATDAAQAPAAPQAESAGAQTA